MMYGACETAAVAAAGVCAHTDGVHCFQIRLAGIKAALSIMLSLTEKERLFVMDLIPLMFKVRPADRLCCMLPPVMTARMHPALCSA